MEPIKIPFGKYKDMPIEALSQDKKYLDWLLAQNWFAEKYRDLHTIIINNFQEPTDTPEHNKLQALFLNNEYCEKFIKVILSHIIPSLRYIDIWDSDYGWIGRCIDKAEINEDFRSHIYDKNFEVHGIDVFLDYGFTLLISSNKEEEASTKYCRREFRIEIKPSVGDDYPSVLRQMISMHTEVLFLEQFTGSGLTEDQFIKIFNNQKRIVIFRRDIKD